MLCCSKSSACWDVAGQYVNHPPRLLNGPRCRHSWEQHWSKSQRAYDELLRLGWPNDFQLEEPARALSMKKPGKIISALKRVRFPSAFLRERLRWEMLLMADHYIVKIYDFLTLFELSLSPPYANKFISWAAITHLLIGPKMRLSCACFTRFLRFWDD